MVERLTPNSLAMPRQFGKTSPGAMHHPHGADYRMIHQASPCLELETIRPVRCEMVSNGLLRVDFGEIYVGYPRLAAKGPKGSAVEIDMSSLALTARHLPFTLRARPNFGDDPVLAKVWQLCVDSFRFGVQEQNMDCMEREKGYYLGDGCYTTYAYCLLTKDWSHTRRFIGRV